MTGAQGGGGGAFAAPQAHAFCADRQKRQGESETNLGCAEHFFLCVKLNVKQWVRAGARQGFGTRYVHAVSIAAGACIT